MSAKHYDYTYGPAVIQQHSVAKHRVLTAYLAEYFRTLVSLPHQDTFSLTVVDGFAGGGLFVHEDTGAVTDGSPLIFLEATSRAAESLNEGRRKAIKLDVDYFFVEADRIAFLHLEDTLKRRGYESRLGNDIQLRCAKFENEADSIIDFIRRKNPRSGRSIFALDQYGYKDVPTHLIKKIFANLSSAEVILTFAVDSLLTYASDSDLTRGLLTTIGISDVLEGRSIEDIKASHKDWRFFLQSRIYRALVERCGARHYTAFFIRNTSGHGDYWLIHMSQHPRARDVMTEVHWANQNNFVHYGGAGLNMFRMIGYDPKHDDAHRGQIGFLFDDEARRASIAALNDHIPQVIFANDAGLSFETLIAVTCNDSPATVRLYREAIGNLISAKEIEVVSPTGTVRRSAAQIRSNDQIRPPAQRKFAFSRS